MSETVNHSSSRTAAARESSRRRRRRPACGDARREALVVELDRARRSARCEALGERARGARSGPSRAPRERQRQADDDALGLRARRPRARTRASPLRVSGRRTGSSGVASVPVGSETATPQRAAPWSSARTRRRSARRGRRSISARAACERLGQLARVAAAGLGHRVAAAAAAADDLRRGLDELARLHAALDGAGRRRRRAGCDLAVAGARRARPRRRRRAGPCSRSARSGQRLGVGRRRVARTTTRTPPTLRRASVDASRRRRRAACAPA